MDNKRIEDIERLLQKMREENMQYRENKQNLYSKTLENEDDDDDFVIESRYKESKKEILPEKQFKAKLINESEEDSSDEEEEAKQRLKKRLDDLKSRKTNLGPPVRVKEIDSESDESTPPPPKVSRPMSRPTTAKVIPSYIQTPVGKKRKNDPVALFQQRQREWKSNSFLKSNNLNTREGRKLNLGPSYHQKNFELNKKKDVHEYIRNEYTAPHEKRRDDVRFNTRVKMMNASNV